MLHIRDLIAFVAERASSSSAASASPDEPPQTAKLNLANIDLTLPLSSAKIVREILYAPPSMPALDLLARMQATRIHLALVIDEYGGTDGLVSMEDLVELIVGDIADEHDEDEAQTIVRQSDGSFLATGRASLEEVRTAIGEEFDVGEAADDVDTIGGYLVTRAGHVPVRGELVHGPDPFETEVLDADPRRVKRVRIYRRKEGRPGPGAARDIPALVKPAPRLVPSPEDTNRSSPNPHAVKPKALFNAIVLSWGWRRCLIAFAAGAVSALAMAPFNAWPVLFLTFPVLVWLIDGSGGQPLGRRRRCGVDRMVVRLRLFCRRTLLDRLRVFGRCADFRLDAAVRGARPAGGAGVLHSHRRRIGAHFLDARRAAAAVAWRSADHRRVSARSPVHRFSVERIRLRDRGAVAAGADRSAGRPVGHDVHHRCRVCDTGDAGRRSHRNAAPRTAADDRRRRADRHLPVTARHA